MKRTIIALIAASALALTAFGCKGKSSASPASPSTPAAPVLKDVIKPVVAGQFYPADRATLDGMIKKFFAETPEIKFPDNLLGFQVPHAGYVYSGPVAAYVFKNIPKGRYKRVVILFPSHWTQFRGVLALDKDGYETPLGVVPIDRESVEKLIAADPAIFWKEGLYRNEHSGEVMLPFLQEALGDTFKIVPLMMADQSPNMASRMADILDKVFADSPETLYIASSDMSHYRDYATDNAMDAIALNQIMHLDIDALIADLKEGRAELCGYGPVLTLMNLSRIRGGKSAKILKHLNSGDTASGKDRVVGYGAVEFFSNE